MNTTNINILCATDDNYVPYCGIMLTSLLMNNQGEKVHVYIMVEDDLSVRNRKRFAKLANTYGATIEYVKVDRSLFEKYPTRNMAYWSLAMYYRILAAELLPTDVEKVLYLDCDIIVTKSIRDLYDTDLTGKALGVVLDVFLHEDEVYERLQYPIKDGYFNSGVLLMNLKYWRENNSIDACMQYLTEHYESLQANDQDLLNAVLHDKTVEMPLTCNYQIQFLKSNFYESLVDYRQEINRTRDEGPMVIHYAYPIKPWSVMYYRMPYKRIWLTYKWKSQWWYKLPELPKRKTINYLVKRFVLWPLGIMYQKEYID